MLLFSVLFVAAAVSFVNKQFIAITSPLWNTKKLDLEQFQKYIKTNGFDHRPQSNSSSSSENMLEIRIFFEKKMLLETLQNPNVPIQVKMRMLEDREYRKYDILAGGLLRDFDFEFE